jgi:hypothetical protein
MSGFATLEQPKKEDERLQHCKVIFFLQKTKKKDIEKD